MSIGKHLLLAGLGFVVYAGYEEAHHKHELKTADNGKTYALIEHCYLFESLTGADWTGYTEVTLKETALDAADVARMKNDSTVFFAFKDSSNIILSFYCQEHKKTETQTEFLNSPVPRPQ